MRDQIHIQKMKLQNVDQMRSDTIGSATFTNLQDFGKKPLLGSGKADGDTFVKTRETLDRLSLFIFECLADNENTAPALAQKLQRELCENLAVERCFIFRKQDKFLTFNDNQIVIRMNDTP